VAYVAGRIWERRDDDNLIEVTYQPPLKDNSSVLDGQLHLLSHILHSVLLQKSSGDARK